LIGAIKDDHILGQRLAHILDSLRFSRSGWSAWSAAHGQGECLGQSYVTSDGGLQWNEEKRRERADAHAADY